MGVAGKGVSILRVLKSLVIVLAMTGIAKAGTFDLYWADGGNGSVIFGNGRVERASLDGSPRETIFFAGADRPHGIGIDTINDMVYWTDTRAVTITRSNLDGTNREVLFDWDTFEANPVGIELDLIQGKMYWVDSTRDSVRRANLDGSGLEDLVEIPGESNLNDIALDLLNGKMYWTDRTSERIQMANLDGSEVVTLFEGGLISRPRGIEVDPIGGKIYFADSGQDGILRANLDGSGLEALLVADTPWGLDLDLINGKIYFTESPFDGLDSISSANLDGSGYERIITDNLDSPRHLAVIPEPTTILILASAMVGMLRRRKQQRGHSALFLASSP